MTELQSGARLQSSLGTELVRQTGEYTISTLVMARVTSINYQLNTVAFRPMTTTTKSNPAMQGSNTAVLPMPFAGRNGYGRAYGEVEPIVVGDIILVGYVEEKSTSPIVIGRYPDSAIAQEVASQDSPSYGATDEATYAQSHRRISVHPDQTYELHDGNGRMELTLSGSSFLLINPDLAEDNYLDDNGEMTISSDDLLGSMDGASQDRLPLNRKAPDVIFKHAGRLTADDKVDTHETFVAIKQDGTYRVSTSKTDEAWKTYFEETPDGAIRLRRQEDSKNFGLGANTSEIGIDKNGYVVFHSQSTGLMLKPDGIYNLDGTKFTATADTTGLEDKFTTELDGAIAGLDHKITEGDKTTEVQIQVFKDELKSKVSEDTLVGALSSQLKAYQDQLDATKTKLTDYKTTLGNIVYDGMIDETEMAQVKSIWADLQAAYPTLVAQCEQYGVDHADLDTTYSALDAYITPIIAEVSTPVDSVTFTTTVNDYLNADATANDDVYQAIIATIGSTSAESIKHLQTIIDQTASQVEITAKKIEQQNDTIAKSEASLKVMAENIKLSLEKKITQSSQDANKAMYGLSVGNINLYAKTQATYGEALDSKTGSMVATPGAYVSQFIEINSQTHYTIFTKDTQGDTTLVYAFYDKDKTYISGDSKTSDQDITIIGIVPPATASYIAIGVNNETKVMLQRGSVKTAYVEAYEDAVYDNTLNTLTDMVKQANATAQADYTAAQGETSVEPAKISALVSDGDFTDDDKKMLQSYLDSYESLKTADDNESEVYVVDNSAYTAAYDQVVKYLTGVIADSSVPDTDVLRAMVETYYTARESFLNAILGTTAGNMSVQLGGVSDSVKQVQDSADKANDAAKSAQDSANQAINDAKSNNSLIADLTDDGKLSPIEKQTVITELSTIQANLLVDTAQAKTYGLDTTAYTKAENAVVLMLTPLLADVSVTSDVDRDTYRTTFSVYYTARTNLLNSIVNVAKKAADDAAAAAKKAADGLSDYKLTTTKQLSTIDQQLDQINISVEKSTTASKAAQDTADTAVQSAKDLETAIGNIGSDGKMTPIEKQTLATNLATIKANKSSDLVQAAKYVVDTTKYEDAEKALEDFFTPLLADMTTTSDVDRDTYESTLSAYNTKRTELLNKVADAISAAAAAAAKAADTAQSNADAVKAAAQAAQNAADAAKQDAKDAQATADGAVSTAKLLQTSIDNIGSDGKMTPVEKQTLASTLATIKANKTVDLAQAGKYSVATSAYNNAEDKVEKFFAPILLDMTKTSTVDRASYATIISSYNSARSNLLNAVADAVNKAAQSAQTSADKAIKNAANLKFDNTNLLVTYNAIPGTLDSTGTIVNGDTEGFATYAWKNFMSGDADTSTTTTTVATDDASGGSTGGVDDPNMDTGDGVDTDDDTGVDKGLNDIDWSHYNNATMLGLIDVIPGESITFHQEDQTDITDKHFHWVWYNINKGVVSSGEQANNLFTLTVPSSVAYLAVSYSPNGNNKVERGTFATVWTENPSDTINRANNNADDLSNLADVVDSNQDSVLAKVSGGDQSVLAQLNDMADQLSKDIDSATYQAKADIKVASDSVTTYVDKKYEVTDASLTKVQNDIYGYMTFNGDALIIGNSKNGAESPFKMSLSSSKLSFMDNGQEVAYVSNQKMYISSVEILNQIKLGHHLITTKTKKSDDGKTDVGYTSITYAG